MAGEHEELCRAIDEELAAFLRCIDNYETASREVSLCPRAPRAGFAQRARRARCSGLSTACAVQIVSACKSGVFDLARARKSMGHSGCAVSQLQYPARMKAAGSREQRARVLKCSGRRSLRRGGG